VAWIVGFAMPDMQGIPDTFSPECVAQLLIVFEKLVLFADDEHYVEMTKLFEGTVVTHVGDEVARHVVVDIFIIVIIEEVAERASSDRQVITTTESDNFGKEMRMAEGEVDGMVCPQATPVGDKTGMGVFVMGEGDDFVENVGFILQVAFDAVLGSAPAAIETFGVYAVEAVELEPTVFDFFGEGLYLPPVFIIKKSPITSGEDEDTGTGVPEDEEFHVSVEGGTIPFVVFAVHTRLFPSLLSLCMVLYHPCLPDYI
jgi:hypothetical protein